MNKPRILLVDDEERFRANLQRMLTAQGMTAQAVDSGEAAMAELTANLYDVILLDLRMPGMDGLATLAAIKKAHPEVEVIVLTGHASMDAAMEIINLGGYDYLLKPCPVDEVMLKIEAAFEKKLDREKRRPQVISQPPSAV